jgi:hypothetical protein
LPQGDALTATAPWRRARQRCAGVREASPTSSVFVRYRHPGDVIRPIAGGLARGGHRRGGGDVSELLGPGARTVRWLPTADVLVGLAWAFVLTAVGVVAAGRATGGSGCWLISRPVPRLAAALTGILFWQVISIRPHWRSP